MAETVRTPGQTGGIPRPRSAPRVTRVWCANATSVAGVRVRGRVRAADAGHQGVVRERGGSRNPRREVSRSGRAVPSARRRAAHRPSPTRPPVPGVPRPAVPPRWRRARRLRAIRKAPRQRSAPPRGGTVVGSGSRFSGLLRARRRLVRRGRHGSRRRVAAGGCAAAAGAASAGDPGVGSSIGGAMSGASRVAGGSAVDSSAGGCSAGDAPASGALLGRRAAVTRRLALLGRRRAGR